MICYVLLANSRESYLRIRSLQESGNLTGAQLTVYDVANYKRLEKIIKNEKNPLRLLYSPKQPYLDVDFDELDYYHVPKDYKKIFKDAKNLEYSLEK